mgnify:CR=1 FL=1
MLSNWVHIYHHTKISGVPTNIGFLKILSQHHAFSAGEVETHFIDNYRSELFDSETLEERSRASHLSAAIAACYICIKDTGRSTQTYLSNNRNILVFIC